MIKIRKGSHHKEESKLKNRLKHLGKQPSYTPFQKGNKIWLGRKHTESTKQKLSIAMTGKKQSKETIAKRVEARKWYKPTQETREKLRQINTGRVITWGDKISKSRIAEDNPNWNGGTSKEPYAFDFNEELKMLIRKRDNFTCQICGKPSVIIHHINYDKKNTNPDNLIVLCSSCHTRTNFNRESWIEYFKRSVKCQ